MESGIQPTKAGIFETGNKDLFGVEYKGVRLLKCRETTLEDYDVAEGTEIICDRAFRDCRHLGTILLPYSITEIGDDAFSGCRELRYINIPDGVAVIRQGTFRDCASLSVLELPESVAKLEKFALGNGLRSLVINNPELKFDRNALTYCNNLELVMVPADSIGYYTQQLKAMHCQASVETLDCSICFPSDDKSEGGRGDVPMKKVIVEVYGIERMLDGLDNEDFCMECYSRFSYEEEMTFTVEGKKYTQDDFADIFDIEPKEVFDWRQEVYAARFFKGQGATKGMLYTNKAWTSIEIEIPEDEEFDPKKAALTYRDFIYPNDTDESMVTSFVYDGKQYDCFPEDSRGIAGEEIWHAEI